MTPTREELLPYLHKRKEAADLYGVSERTIIRWMKKLSIYQPKANFGCGKLDMNKAQEIRRLHKEGRSMKELASQYGVTFSTISRVIHNIIYKYEKTVADVSVVYNISPGTGPFSAYVSDPAQADNPSGDSE